MYWHTQLESCLLEIPLLIKQELFTVVSLTQRIAMHGNFSVEILQQGRQRKCSDRFVLANGTGPIYTREVVLYCDETPVVFAKTVLPLSSIKRELSQLVTLKNKSLGALLHTSKNIESSDSEVALVSKGDYLYPLVSLTENLWARRTLYKNRSSSLLVNEVFLPAYWQMVKKT